MLYEDEAEVRHRVLQAFSIAPQMTMGMLQGYLTSKVNNAVRDTVIDELVRSKKLTLTTIEVVSYRQRTVVHTVLKLIEESAA